MVNFEPKKDLSGGRGEMDAGRSASAPKNFFVRGGRSVALAGDRGFRLPLYSGDSRRPHANSGLGRE
jgi:hypothetical protein